VDDDRARELMYRAVRDRAGEPPPAQWQEFAAGFRLRRMASGEHFQRGGDRAERVAFVCAGLMRMYYLRGDGREFNKSFVVPPDFVGVLESLVTGDPSRLSIQCLDATTVLEIDYATASSFFDRDIYWQRFGRLFAESLYVKKARREASLLMDPPLVRYEEFVRNYASIAESITDYHIASYVGITPEALSRLRRSRARTRARS
jgi:CRP/FNR family transcriptional regulator, anaerobic regulatory protein